MLLRLRLPGGPAGRCILGQGHHEGQAGQCFFPLTLLCSLSRPGAVQSITLFTMSSPCVSVKAGKRRLHETDVQCCCVC